MIVGPVIASFAQREMSPPLPKVTRANAGGPRPLQVPGCRATRIARFRRSPCVISHRLWFPPRVHVH
jgi:hypothetical protein